LTAGCIRRSLTIRSQPPGAELIVNDKHLGTTPLSYDFEWYGWYRLTLMKEGYERLDDRVRIRAPFYFWIPLDLVMELLPLSIRDDQVLSYELTPRQPLPEPSPPVVGEPTSTQQEGSPTTEESPVND